MSDHRVDIIEVGEILPHPNPEVTRMELTHILGWQCCVGKGQFQKGDRAIYIEPDYVCPTAHPSFAFLARKDGKPQERIRVRRFKGTLSQGLLISVPDELDNLSIGTNVIEQLGIERYEPPLPKSTGGDFVGAPSGLYCPKFDVENWQRWANKFAENEIVNVTEKLHGCLHEDTPVMLSNGEYVPVQDIKKGDMILSYDGSLFVHDEVMDVMHEDNDKQWIELFFENGSSIKCTEDHEFLTDKGWIPASRLDKNHELISI